MPFTLRPFRRFPCSPLHRALAQRETVGEIAYLTATRLKAYWYPQEIGNFVTPIALGGSNG